MGHKRAPSAPVFEINLRLTENAGGIPPSEHCRFTSAQVFAYDSSPDCRPPAVHVHTAANL